MGKKLKFNREDIEQLLENGFIDKDKKFHQFVYLTYVDDEYAVCDLKTDEWFLQDEVFIVSNAKITMEDYDITTIDLKAKCFAIKRKCPLGVFENVYDLIKHKKRLFITDDKWAYELDKEVVESVNSMIKQYKKSGI